MSPYTVSQIPFNRTNGKWTCSQEVVNYYPFGWQMKDKSYNYTSMRFDFNDKETDRELIDWQNYGKRMYMKRVVRFNSVDPLNSKYPGLSSYQFAANRPIDGIDLDGLEFQKKSYYKLEMAKAQFVTSKYKIVYKEAQQVTYRKQNMPGYFKEHGMRPESATKYGYDTYGQTAGDIKPDYSMTQSLAQTDVTAAAQEPMGTTKMGAWGGFIEELMKWVGIGAEIFGSRNQAMAEAYQDKQKFYASINLVDNYYRIKEVPEWAQSQQAETDLKNWVNTGAVPYTKEEISKMEGKEKMKAKKYNKKVERLGKKIYNSRHGWGQTGEVSTEPQKEEKEEP
jgi:RHS repeat-associated protein